MHAWSSDAACYVGYGVQAALTCRCPLSPLCAAQHWQSPPLLVNSINPRCEPPERESTGGTR